MRETRKTLHIFFRIFLQVIKTSPLTGILSLLYTIIEGLFPACITAISVLLFDNVAKYFNDAVDISRVRWLGMLLVASYGMKQIFQYISSITVNAGVYEKVSSFSNRLLYEKCARIPLIEYENAEKMDYKSRACKCIEQAVISQLYMINATMIMNIVGVLSTIVILSTYSLLFIPISILSVIPYFVVRIIRGKEFYELKKQHVKKERRRDYLWSLFSNKQSAKEMRVMGFGEYISHKWVTSRDEINEEIWKLVKKDGLSLFFCDLIRIFGYGLCILLSFVLVINADISVGVFGACIAAFASVQGQTKAFLIELGNIPEKLNYARDYFDFIDRTANVCDCKTKLDNIKNISFYNVSFSYPNTKEKAINNLNFSIDAGEKIAIVGENGSGKTTFTKILLGMYRSDEGKICINNIDLSQYDEEDYLRRVSIISQHFIKYRMTLRENVAISNISSSSDDESIWQALRDADIEFDELGDDLDQILGTDFGGIELSGGQWQKVAIARGIFRDSELIVMDEPTSAIDPITETKILKNFLKIAKNKTAIIVSHRTGLCTLVDKIAVMKNGQIVEVGTHENLLMKNGEYAKLFNAQRQWYI